MATEQLTDEPERYFQLLSPLKLWEANSKKYQATRHHWLIDREFRHFVYEPNDIDILVVTAPPRHGKSTYLSQWAPAHYLGRRPEHQVMLCSYGSGIAKFHSREARNIYHMTAPLFGQEGVDPAASAANDWRTREGGGMLSAGVAGSVTGRGAHVILIDDYLRSAQDAMSPRTRENQWEWFTATISTRREPGGKIVVLATPWHREDIIGMLKSHAEELDLKVKYVHLQALYDGKIIDPLGREKGEALWPERWTEAVLQKQKKLMGPYWWQAQYMGNPGLRGETEWPEEYFENIMVPPDDFPERMFLDSITLDPSKGKTDRSDYQASVYVGYHRGKLWVDCRADREPVPRMVRQFVRRVKHFHPTLVGVETNQFQELLVKDFWDACEELGYARDDEVQQLENKVNKYVRILRLGTYLHDGIIKIKDNKGGRILKQQLEDFPNADHDDCPDSLEMSIRLLANLTGMEHGDPETLIYRA